jgi:hypothetical protein
VVPTKTDRKLEVVNVIAGLDLAEESWMNLQVPGGAVKLSRDDAVEV